VPLSYRHIAVLLRSTKHSAAALTHMLDAQGIPAWTDAAGSLLDAREIRDVLALLSVIDNIQQDIPLTGVMRAGLCVDPFTEDELVEIRSLDRRAAYHETVRAYPRRGSNAKLRDKVSMLLDRLERFRVLARARPMPEVLWRIYQQTGYLSYVGGLPGGSARRARLLALHEHARRFSGFRRQGLYRFLRFVESLADADEQLSAPQSTGQADDVVQVLSIHKSKGRQFPVVICAEMGRALNLTDSSGRMIYDRRHGLGLKVVERDRLIEYPSALHALCARSSREQSRAEELRCWYVALTRAMQRLILVGTERMTTVERRMRLGRLHAGSESPLMAELARSPLDWIAGVLGGLPETEVNIDGQSRSALFQVRTYSPDVIRSFSPGDTRDRSDGTLHRAVASLQSLPGDEPVSAEKTEAMAAIERLDRVYPHLGVTALRAAQSASEAKRLLDPWFDDEAPAVSLIESKRTSLPPTGGRKSESLRRGVATHTILQHIDLKRTWSVEAIRTEVDRLVAEGLATEADTALVDIEALAWFFSDKLGQRACKARRYLREWMFLSSEPIALFDPTLTSETSDRVLVRGVIDGLLDDGSAVEIIDFKTDPISASDVEARATRYRIQMLLYQSATSAALGRPPSAAHLVFLHPRRIVTWTADQLAWNATS